MERMSYRFSVSMCVYGGDNANWLQLAIDSVMNQTVQPDEIVIVVDGPVPNCINDVLLEYSLNKLFKIIRLEENQGHGIARKICLENCSNNLVAVMDADDISVCDRFEKQLLIFKNNSSVDVVGGAIAEFDGLADNVVGKRVVPVEDFHIKEYMKKRCPMNLVTVMFKKDSVNKVGGFIDWYCEEDYYLWIRMALANMKFANTSDVLVRVRVGKDMYHRRGGIKYFSSEVKLQIFMLANNIIGIGRFCINFAERLILQVLMPNKARGFFYQKFARTR